MNFHKLDQKIQENKNYKLAARYIIENDIDLNEFFENILFVLSENEENPGFFQRIKQNVSNMWNKFRGNPYDINSVTNALSKASQFLSGNEKLKAIYNNEISALADINKNIQTKSKPETASETEPSNTPTKNEDLKQSYLKRLTYGQPVETLANTKNEKPANLYAEELAKQNKHEIENLKNKLIERLKRRISIVEKIIKIPADKKNILDHETWALWDIGKQLYMMNNPSNSGEGYTVGNPLTDKNIQEDIINRMIGYAVASGPDHISSLKLAELGKQTLDKALNNE
jgi:hypothetical protein